MQTIGPTPSQIPRTPLAHQIAKLEAQQRQRVDASEFPADLLDVGGIIGDMVKLIVDTAISPQPALALAAALCTAGAVAGRQYRTASNLRTNLYIIGIADSGSGKDHARQIIKEALFKAGLQDYIGGGKIASGSGLLTSIERHPCRLFLLDEMGKFVRSVTGFKAPAHREEIWTILTELYTSAGSVYLGAEYADQKLRPRVDIREPCCSIYGVTVPGPFWSAIEGGALTDGSLARFLIFQTEDDYPDRVDQSQAVVIPDHIITGLQSIAAGYGGKSDGSLPMMPDVSPNPYIVPTTPEADIILKMLLVEQTEWLRSKRGTNDTAVIARYAENVNKVALIRAISDCPGNPVITQQAVVWATGLVKRCITTLLRDATRYVADTPHQANLNKLENFIREKGEVSAEQLARGIRVMDAKTRASLLLDLKLAERITEETRDTGGKTLARVYRWVG